VLAHLSVIVFWCPYPALTRSVWLIVLAHPYVIVSRIPYPTVKSLETWLIVLAHPR
jgi:hypothetical protein